MVALGPLLLLYPRADWARSAVNSGLFSRFPLLHKSVLNSGWARRRLFRAYADRATGAEEVAHYLDQAVCPIADSKPLPLARAENPLGELQARGRYLLLLGRSGTGKTVLMRRLHRLEAARFRAGKTVTLPVLIDTPTHLGQSDLADALKDAVRRDGKVELPDDVLDFLIRKGRFLILVDSLNELPQAANSIRPFLNRDAHNTVVMASQIDVLRREDVAIFAMVEISTHEAEAYLDATIGPGGWDALTPGLRTLSRNPQDLALIAEVAVSIGLAKLPDRRAALYAAKVENDSVLRSWVTTADPSLDIVYALAFRLLAERRVADELTFAGWTREALIAHALDPQQVTVILEAVRRSGLFRWVISHDQLGRSQPALTFDHELIGAFLAARHVRAALQTPERDAMLELAAKEEWQNVFFFVVDEIEPPELNRLLNWLVGCGEADVICDTRGSPILDTAGEAIMNTGNPWAVRIVAYALGTKPAGMIRGEVHRAYNRIKLRQDIEMTPAA